jgi:hypothetical protein
VSNLVINSKYLILSILSLGMLLKNSSYSKSVSSIEKCDSKAARNSCLEIVFDLFLSILL